MNLYWNTERSIFFLDQSLKDVVWKLDGITPIGKAVRDDPFPISYGSPNAPEFLVDEVKYGDGYTQRALSGLRATAEVFEVKFIAVPDVGVQAMKRFLQGGAATTLYNRTPAEWFFWLPPAPLRVSAVPLHVTCNTLRVTPVTWNSNEVSATFMESFQP